ncbi:MAG: ImmA/IrrE family metallo-endopeptidase, partial [Candidatus Symbiobacter sp.]|nr:ImmA/IrrE family metallo-endopeptidase [Candidatus Symbiobacter sp.]
SGQFTCSKSGQIVLLVTVLTFCVDFDSHLWHKLPLMRKRQGRDSEMLSMRGVSSNTILLWGGKFTFVPNIYLCFSYLDTNHNFKNQINWLPSCMTRSKLLGMYMHSNYFVSLFSFLRYNSHVCDSILYSVKPLTEFCRFFIQNQPSIEQLGAKRTMSKIDNQPNDNSSNAQRKINEYHEPVASGKSPQFIKAFAYQAADIMGYTPKTKDFRKLITDIGGKLYELADMPSPYENRRSCVFVEENKKFIIFTSELSETKKQRFDIAHELGHYFLHYMLPYAENKDNPPTRLKAGRGLGNVSEKSNASEHAEERENLINERASEDEANLFAFAFLIKDETFNQTLGDFKGDLKLTADYYGVSPYIIKLYADRLVKKSDQGNSEND